MTSLLNDLLDLQKMESGMQPYFFNMVDLVWLICEVLDSFQADASHRFEVRLPSEPLYVYVYVDEDRIKQALRNLISNAIKYSPEGEQVDVELEEHDGKEVLLIRDYGLGIPEEARAKC